MLKNSSILAASVPINLSIALDFVSINGPRETYFVDRPRISKKRGSLFCQFFITNKIKDY